MLANLMNTVLTSHFNSNNLLLRFNKNIVFFSGFSVWIHDSTLIHEVI